MKVRNVSGVGRHISATDQEVEADGTVEVPKALGESLCEQPDNWQPVASKSTKNTEGDD